MYLQLKKYHRLNEAFKDLRKSGYFARQNFQCCQSCAWAAIPEEKEEKVVFYHQQDAARKEDKWQIWLQCVPETDVVLKRVVIDLKLQLMSLDNLTLWKYPVKMNRVTIIGNYDI
jgi:hypothetical protein